MCVNVKCIKIADNNHIPCGISVALHFTLEQFQQKNGKKAEKHKHNTYNTNTKCLQLIFINASVQYYKLYKFVPFYKNKIL